MLDHRAIVDADRVVNLVLAGFGWAYVLVESLNKRVDVPTLSQQLKVREAQLMAGVIEEIEIAVLPFLSSPLQEIAIDETGEEDPEEDQYEDYAFPTVLGERAKDSLARSLRNSDDTLQQMYHMRRLPRRILRLNGCVFWCFLALAISSSIGAFFEYAFSAIPFWAELASTYTPLIPGAAAVGYGVTRHLKVQRAEENIIDSNS
jgi:hypothetical protein